MIRNKAKMPTISLLFNILLEILNNAITQVKSIRDMRNENKELKLSLFADDMILCMKNSMIKPI